MSGLGGEEVLVNHVRWLLSAVISEQNRSYPLNFDTAKMVGAVSLPFNPASLQPTQLVTKQQSSMIGELG